MKKMMNDKLFRCAMQHLLILACLGLFLHFTPSTAQARGGDLDLSFGSGGSVLSPFGVDIDGATGVVVQPDQKIVAGGYSTDASGFINFTVARYLPNGALDVTFGVGGVVITPVSDNFDLASAIALQPDGKILLAGTAISPTNHQVFATVRYNTNGSLDSTFGNSGVVLTQIGTGYAGIYGMTLQPDGKIVVAGFADGNGGDTLPGDYDFALARYLSNGSPDTSFGTNGVVTTPVGTFDDIGRAVIVQPNGKIVVGGQSTISLDVGDYAMARFNSNGSLDNGFGVNGKVITPITPANDSGNALAINSHGELLLAGTSNIGVDSDMVVVKYKPNGQVDTRFGSNGISMTQNTNSLEGGGSIILTNNGRILVAGSTNANGPFNMAVFRLKKNGSPDNTFGQGGVADSSLTNSEASAMALQADCRIVVAGGSFSSGLDFALARFSN